MEIKDIQNWEKDFAKRKIPGFPPKNKEEADRLLQIIFLKLSEETGELAEVILRKRYEDIPAEVADVTVFACKIAKIAEDYFDQPSLSETLEKKIEYTEKRKYDEKSRKLTKPEGEFHNG